MGDAAGEMTDRFHLLGLSRRRFGARPRRDIDDADEESPGGNRRLVKLQFARPQTHLADAISGFAFDRRAEYVLVGDFTAAKFRQEAARIGKSFGQVEQAEKLPV